MSDKKNKYEEEFKCEKIYLTGSEIFSLQAKKEKEKAKFAVTFLDGNYIQRDYEEWSEEQVSEYKQSLKYNFPHTPFYALEKDKKWYIVDGQHRFKTILKIIEENDKYEDFWILQKLFEFIICKKNDKWNFEDFGSHIFTILNNKALTVSNGSLYKSLFISKDKETTINLINKYSKHFNTKKAKNVDDEYKRDEIFVVLANASFLIHKKDKIKDIKSMKKSLIEYLESNFFNKNSIKNLLKLVEKFILKNVFNKDNKLIKKPKLQTLYVSFAIASSEKGIDKVKKLENCIDTFEKTETWKDSTKNTRTPSALYYKYKIIEKSNSEKELIENTEKFLK